MSNVATTEKPAVKAKRGFACISKERRATIAGKGGRAAHAKGTAHEFTSDEAREAGRKGGVAVSANREHMSRIGALGGRAKRKTPAPNNEVPAADLSVDE